jgi:hypothetical protein
VHTGCISAIFARSFFIASTCGGEEERKRGGKKREDKRRHEKAEMIIREVNMCECAVVSVQCNTANNDLRSFCPQLVTRVDPVSQTTG